MNNALKQALQAVLAEIQRADGAALAGGGKGVKVEIEAGGEEGGPGPGPMAGGEECPMCAAGECSNPDHMDESALSEMASGY